MNQFSSGYTWWLNQVNPIKTGFCKQLLKYFKNNCKWLGLFPYCFPSKKRWLKLLTCNLRHHKGPNESWGHATCLRCWWQCQEGDNEVLQYYADWHSLILKLTDILIKFEIIIEESNSAALHRWNKQHASCLNHHIENLHWQRIVQSGSFFLFWWPNNLHMPRGGVTEIK